MIGLSYGWLIEALMPRWWALPLALLVACMIALLTIQRDEDE